MAGEHALGDLATFSSGGTPSKREPDNYRGRIPWITGADIDSYGQCRPRSFISDAATRSSAAPLVGKGTVLLVTRTSVGKVAIAHSSMSFSQDITGIHPNASRLNADYLRHFLISEQQTLKARSRGATIKGVTREVVANLTLTVPDLAEQERIAQLLSQSSRILEKRTASLNLLTSMSESLFRREFGDPRAGSKGLPMSRLGDLATIGTGSTPSRSQPAFFGGEIPWVKTTEVQGGTINDTIEHLTAEGLKASRCKLYPQGSIVIALYGQGRTRGQCAMLDVEAATNQACAVLVPDDSYDSTFMFSQLKLSYQRLREMGRGGSQENLNLGLIGNFPVIAPPLERQRKFANVDRKIQGLRRMSDEHLLHLNSLFASLQSRAFKGEL
jgi:type I restriction enzyme S subunit